MKKLLLLTGLLVSALLSQAQLSENEKSIALQLVQKNSVAIGLTPTDVKDGIITGTYVIPGTNIRMVYLQQGYKGLPVYNQLKVLAFQNGQIVSNAGELLSGMDERTQFHSGIASVSAPAAVTTALIDRNVNVKETPVSLNAPLNGEKFDFGKMGVSSENINAELIWLPVPGSKEVKLVWQVFVCPLTTSDYWLVRVDATTNTVIDKLNLTITCNWDPGKHSIEEHVEKNHSNSASTFNYIMRKDENNQWQYRPFVVNSATYRVIKYPAESPQHPGGAHQLHTDPWTWAPGNATSLGWHYDGAIYHDSTRGNNVWAQEDRDNNNLTFGKAALSTTPQPNLTIDYTPDYTQAPILTSPPNQQFNTTNLFYWNNLMHDLSYQYGFTESARNFQNDNQGRGGLGLDYVIADAQDAGGTNNANFATPADGSRPRMQMYLWTFSSPQRDGDVDNSVICHEYTHGISNRMTGTGSGCLSNAEQMGEGWSDYYALMATTNWATATPTDGFNIPRPIGLYALNNTALFPVPGNPGIRHYPYSTNMAVNPVVYAPIIPASAHDRGEIWCSALWDMTWNLIQQDGISSNLFNATSVGGNVVAMKLVTEGLRLQPCSPGMISGRDAILRADTLFYGGVHSCAIIRAFARRGMGIGASQGSSGSVTDQIPSFDDGTAFVLNQNSPVVLEGGNIVYSNRLTANCSALSNYTITDTLPLGVTYVSGGAYNAGNRTVTFTPVNVPAGATNTYSFTVNVNVGTYFVPVTHLNDAATAIPPNWGSTAAPNDWVVSNAQSHSAPSSFFASDPAVVSDKILTTTGSFAVPSGPAAYTSLTFWHWYNTELNWDGGVVEISTNGGGTWSDLGAFMIQNGYDITLNASANPLTGRRAFSGNSGAFVETKINLSSFAGQTIKIRFRMGSDASVGATGWYVDDIVLRSEPLIFMRSNLFDAGMIRLRTSDTVTQILPGVCTDPAITAHPASVVRCSVSGNAVFSATATGTALTYQWYVSTNGGVTWSPIAGATNTTYTIVNPTSALNGNLYRMVATGLCGSPATTNAAVLYVSPALTHSGVSATPSVTCVVGASTITGTVSGGTSSSALIGSTGAINLVIPDNDPTGVNSTIELPALSFQQAGNMRIRVNMTHTWVGDLSVKLTSPCGTTFVFDRPGVPASASGNSDNLAGVYIFDLSAATIIPETTGGTGVVAPGNYLPSDNSNPGVAHNWAGFTFPCSAAGTWTLNVSDNAGLDVGTLVDWGIMIGGNYTHGLTGPGTIVQNPPSGTNNSTGNFSVSALAAGVHTFVLTSTDVLGCTVTTNVTVTVTSAPGITSQPPNRTICAGGSTTIPVTDNSPLPPTYQWEISTNGGASWTPLTNVPPFSGVTTNTLVITGAGTVYNGNLFRVVISNACGTTTSNNATLTVNPLPNVTVGPSGQCAPVVLTASGNANTYTWSPATGLSSTTGAVVTASPTVTTVYTVTGTITATGCQNSATVTVLGTPVTPVITPPAPVICQNTVVQLTVPATPGTSTVSSGPIAVPVPDNSAVGATHTLVVSGIPAGALITGVSVTFNMTHTFDGDMTFNLVAPNGNSLNLVNRRGGSGDNFVNTTISSASSTSLGPPAAAPFTGTFAADGVLGLGPTAYPSNVTTFPGLYSTPNGNWILAMRDYAGADLGTLTSWSITINYSVQTAVWTPITGLFTNSGGSTPYVAGTPLNTIYASPQTTTTYTVTNVLGTCSSASATVTVTVNPAPTISVGPNNQCGPVTLTATGNSNTYAWTPAAGLNTTTGPTVIANPTFNTTYTVTGTITATGCTASANVTVNATPAAPIVTPANPNICLGSTVQLNVTPTAVTSPLGGTITIPAGAPTNTSGNGDPYPGAITLNGLPTTGVRVKSVQINGISHTFPGDIDMLLQSPTGTNVILMSDAGGGTDILNANLVFDDAAAAGLPAVIVSGTYKPTNTTGPDNFPAPGPGNITNINPTLSSFTGNMNGTWNLYVVDQFGGDVGVITSWSITFEITGAVFSPVTGLYTDPGATVPYVAGTMVSTLYAKPTTTTAYTVTRSTPTCTSPATTVTVTVFQPIAITTQPASQTVCQGANVTFSVVTTGNFQTYQWQISTNGGTTWTNIAGATGASLVLPNVQTTLSGNQYRVIVTNSCSTVTSSAATLTVGPLPTITIGSLPARICISDTLVSLVGLGQPVGGFWSGTGVSGFNFIPGATAVGTYTLTYSYTNSFGCTNTGTVIARVQDCPERIIRLTDNAVILYPNPNNGQFNIRINSTLYNYLGMKVFNAAGQLIKVQQFGGLVYGRVIPIDLSNFPAGVYMVKFYYDDGIRTSEKTFPVIVGGH